MTQMLRDWTGRVVHAAPRPTESEELGAVEGITIRVPGESSMAEKAPRRGKYLLNGITFRIQAGDNLPAGAVFVDERAVQAAPENRAVKAAPENRVTRPAAKKQPAKKGD